MEVLGLSGTSSVKNYLYHSGLFFFLPLVEAKQLSVTQHSSKSATE